MIRLFKIIILFATLSFITYSQPKLIVGIVIDQMRYDYLNRFYSNYGNEGFKRLMNDGANFTFAHFNYVPIYTASGHASVYTGTVPFYHGITGNEIYDPVMGKVRGAAEDENGNKYSPLNLLSNTIGDQLKLSNNFRSKVISISIKDRGAILPGGRYADAAYWYDHTNGEFVSSEYYMKSLPQWMVQFNNRKLAYQYAEKTWELSFPIENYKNSLPDEAAYELDIFNEGRKSFPHSLKNVPDTDKPGTLISTPWGNQILIDLAEAVLDNEKLGMNDVPDMLCISLTSTDYVGHQYGPNSVELHDLYIKTDLQIAYLLNTLDDRIGEGNYIVFLTTDHGVAEMQSYVKKTDKEYLEYDSIKTELKHFAQVKYGDAGIFSRLLNKQVYLDYEKVKGKGLEIKQVRYDIMQHMRHKFPYFTMLYTRDDLAGQIPRRDNNNPILNGFNNIRSGDIFFELAPIYFLGKDLKEATHGTPYPYDTHAPMLFYGYGVKQQVNNKPVFITDIAPTITSILGIMEPSGCIGIPLLK